MHDITYEKGRVDGAWYMFTVMVVTYIIAYIILDLFEPVAPNSCQKGV